jgi:hypothetical protein
MEPIYQIQLLPGVREIAPGILPDSRLLVRWDIDIPSLGRVAKGAIRAVERMPGVGDIPIANWRLIPAYTLDPKGEIIVFTRPAYSTLILESGDYTISRLSFFLAGGSNLSLPTTNTYMGINISSSPAPTANNENIVEVNAATVVATVPANPNRLGGYIVNDANRSMWVKWGNSAGSPALAASLPFSEVPPGNNIEIDLNFTGSIGLIWSNGVNTSKKAYVHELIP